VITHAAGRGNSYDRRRRKVWMLKEFDKDLGPDKARCFKCKKILTYETITADRIIPGLDDGSYRHENLRPACGFDNSSDGAKLRWSRR